MSVLFGTQIVHNEIVQKGVLILQQEGPMTCPGYKQYAQGTTLAILSIIYQIKSNPMAIENFDPQKPTGSSRAVQAQFHITL